MIKNKELLLILIIMSNVSCNNNSQKQQDKKVVKKSYKEGSFGYDLHFLQRHDSLIVLQADGGSSKVIVSPKYQAKVFTSTAAGDDGKSFGWVNYKAFTAQEDAHMNAYGGENRLWLGPEGGKFSLFFKSGTEMVFNNWKTPAPIDTEAWSVVNKSSDIAVLQKQMKLTNYKGNELQILVDRTVQILDKQQINKNIGVALDSKVKAVGYETVNVLTNKGSVEWTEETGMPCMWLLDMFKPTLSTVILVPYKSAKGIAFNEVATTNYFGEIPAERLKHADEVLFFKADGKSRGKLGIKRAYAKPVGGSYDTRDQILTLVTFEVDPAAKYLNQEWNTKNSPFSGDAVNAYNDGPLKDGTQMGPFYEIESVSPAAFLKPNQSLSHKHSVYHFSGSETVLDEISKKYFGVSLNDIKKDF